MRVYLGVSDTCASDAELLVSVRCVEVCQKWKVKRKSAQKSSVFDAKWSLSITSKSVLPVRMSLSQSTETNVEALNVPERCSDAKRIFDQKVPKNGRFGSALAHFGIFWSKEGHHALHLMLLSHTLLHGHALPRGIRP